MRGECSCLKPGSRAITQIDLMTCSSLYSWAALQQPYNCPGPIDPIAINYKHHSWKE